MLFGLFSRGHIRRLDDTQLLKLVREKNAHALGEIFQRYSPLVMGLCLKYMKNVQDSEDIVMMLFEKLPEKLSKHEVQNFKSWLYSVSRNECLMQLRKKKIVLNDTEGLTYFPEDESEKRLEETLKKEEVLSSLEETLNELKEEQKMCITLFYLEKKSYTEITELTGYTLKKVKSYIQNGKRNLKLLIGKNSAKR